MKRAIVSVISDLVTDQRVHRTALALRESGYAVTCTGRRLRSSPELQDRPYRVRRFRLWWEKGALFYAAFNLRLFLYLLYHKADLLYANDLDTLLPNYLVSRLKGIPLIYDSHEYFTEVPELQGRPGVKKTWQFIERMIFPRLQHVITVNDSIAELYRERYGKTLTVIRNVPERHPPATPATRSSLGIPEQHAVVIFQGSGINIHRGAEEALEAMHFLEGVTLLFVGGGDVIPELKQRAEKEQLTRKVVFVPRQDPERLRSYTALAQMGLSLDKDNNINYRFSLPNKLFDYIHAGIPVLASDLPEVRKIVEGYGVGIITPSHEPAVLAECIRNLLNTPAEAFVENLRLAADALSWEKEKKKLTELLHAV
jgi:glycosyltransferase involved in cell wall biosynthesis